jgi:hypothetical protein
MSSPDRVPLTEVHRKGVADPMTASLIRVPGTGNRWSYALRSAACLQAAEQGQGGQRLSRRGRGLLGLFFSAS